MMDKVTNLSDRLLDEANKTQANDPKVHVTLDFDKEKLDEVVDTVVLITLKHDGENSISVGQHVVGQMSLVHIESIMSAFTRVHRELRAEALLIIAEGLDEDKLKESLGLKEE